MPKNILSTKEKIAKLEERKKTLIKQREKELVDIIHKYKAIDIDNDLLSNFFLFAMDKDNEENEVFGQLKAYAERKKKPSRGRELNTKTAKESQ